MNACVFEIGNSECVDSIMTDTVLLVAPAATDATWCR